MPAHYIPKQVKPALSKLDTLKHYQTEVENTQSNSPQCSKVVFAFALDKLNEWITSEELESKNGFDDLLQNLDNLFENHRLFLKYNDTIIKLNKHAGANSVYNKVEELYEVVENFDDLEEFHRSMNQFASPEFYSYAQHYIELQKLTPGKVHTGDIQEIKLLATRHVKYEAINPQQMDNFLKRAQFLQNPPQLNEPPQLTEAQKLIFVELKNEIDKLCEKDLIKFPFNDYQTTLLERIKLIEELNEYEIPQLDNQRKNKYRWLTESNPEDSWSMVIKAFLKDLKSLYPVADVNNKLTTVKTKFDDLKKTLLLQSPIVDLTYGHTAFQKQVSRIYGCARVYNSRTRLLHDDVKQLLVNYLNTVLRPYTSLGNGFLFRKSIVREQTINTLKEQIVELMNQDKPDAEGKPFCYRLAVLLHQAEMHTINDHKKGFWGKHGFTKSRLAETLHASLNDMVKQSSITREELAAIRAPYRS